MAESSRKRKVVPVHTMKAQVDKVQCHPFLTLALEGGEWLTTSPSHFTTPTPERKPASIEQEAVWAPVPVWTSLRTEKPLTTIGIQTTECPACSLVIIPTRLLQFQFLLKHPVYVSCVLESWHTSEVEKLKILFSSPTLPLTYREYLFFL